MLVYYQSNRFNKTIEIADVVLNYTNLEPSIKWDALKLKARSALKLNDFSTAKLAFRELENAPQTNLVAEALFFKAEQLFEAKEHEESNKIITKIAGNSNQSGIWNAKALLLLAKNYYALDDAFQAIYILESLLENFNSYTEIVDEAAVLIEKYKAEEAPRSSIEAHYAFRYAASKGQSKRLRPTIRLRLRLAYDQNLSTAVVRAKQAVTCFIQYVIS